MYHSYLELTNTICMVISMMFNPEIQAMKHSL